ALLSDPKVLMVDEPSQGLAPRVCDQLFEVIAGLPAQGIAVLLVEQFVSRALELSERAYVMAKGELTYAGSAAELASDESFVASSYLGDVDEQVFETVLAEEQAEPVVRRRRLDPERTPLVAELPVSVRDALVELAAERGVEPESLIEELVEQEAHRR